MTAKQGTNNYDTDSIARNNMRPHVMHMKLVCIASAHNKQ